MQEYVRNPRCSCARCRSNGLMGAAILVTLGVLFLLQENDIVWFHQSWPVLLLVIGAFIFLGRTASTENHIQPYSGLPPQNPTAWGPGVATPVPPAPPEPGSPVNDQQVKP